MCYSKAHSCTDEFIVTILDMDFPFTRRRAMSLTGSGGKIILDPGVCNRTPFPDIDNMKLGNLPIS